ncbi:uncharacterized protein LOC130571278 [Triplophysa rosa]|uniref:Uncharacterized protein n=1 Tax=Triplophysa rosa TaxID=992332 RepID=A0A9W7X3L1_TRIRA|nr:uncharacterized protein LOC130571278 [Triplophysa rosa]XP_057218143.1 uncharacterized protein LOC130571278 [Triplophysa rosa]KAI7813321.1 hypothetical protein IRJ41_016342 [Triplophysa rosa]
MRDIIPKNKIKGVDFCGGHIFTYIIRSDLGCYMRSTDLHKGSDLTIFKLHPSCQNGDHYFADWSGRFYIIKGKSYRRVTDLSIDTHAEVKDIHPDFQGADHYIHFCTIFLIFFQAKGIYRFTIDLSNNFFKSELKLHPKCSNGLYYWGLLNKFCFLKPVSEWGVEYFTCSDPQKDDGHVYSVHPDVVNFLPGGLSITQGPAFGRWESIKTINIANDTKGTWRKKILKKVGYNKEKMKEITHNWKFGASATIESGDLVSLIAKFQFTFSAEYGGSNVNTEKESWDEANEVEEELTLELKPNESVYLWQYKLGFGDEPMLFCRDLKIDDEPNPPTEIPLPPAKP